MDIFSELSILIVVATGMALVMRLLHQPLIIGHILTGLIAGPFLLDIVQSTETLAFLSHIGIAILLFTVGLHLNPALIRKFGRIAFVTGIGQVVITSFAGYLFSVALGYSHIASFYIGVALAFSSTIIIMKLITDKGDVDTLYAKIAIGFLIVQDLIAVLLIMAIPLFSGTESSPISIAKLLGMTVLLVGFIALTGKLFLSRFNQYLEESQEFLFLFAIAWGIGIAALFHSLGLSLESGALIAGIALASLPSRIEIAARLAPLRDFFIILFFIYLGSQLELSALGALIPIAILLSALVLIGNPLILMAIMGYMGYRKKTSLQTGFTVAQISEFSLILMALGLSLGHVSQEDLSLVTLVGLTTIFGSTYLILYSDTIYKYLEPFLGFFERSNAHESHPRRKHYGVILFGCNRIGYDFMQTLQKLDRSFLVVDHDPERIKELDTQDVQTLFGDASNLSFLEEINFSHAELVISTIPSPEINALIHKVVRAQAPEAVVIVLAHRISDALAHYDDGIDYVILPHFLGGKHAAELVLKLKGDRARYEKLRDDHREHLELRLSIGHEHPRG